jgi:type II secretory pathway component PulJ
VLTLDIHSQYQLLQARLKFRQLQQRIKLLDKDLSRAGNAPASSSTAAGTAIFVNSYPVIMVETASKQ